jgi:hypothetical protein
MLPTIILGGRAHTLPPSTISYATLNILIEFKLDCLQDFDALYSLVGLKNPTDRQVTDFFEKVNSICIALI